MSPSASASASPSAQVTGPIDEIVIVRQQDEITITDTPVDEITATRQADEITIVEAPIVEVGIRD